MAGATRSADNERSGAADHRVRREWSSGHTTALVALVVVTFAVGLIPSNRLVPGFAPAGHALVTWLITIVLLFAASIVIGHGTTGLWKGILIDARNRLSLSRLQLLLWTVLVLSAFLTVAMFNIRKDPTDNPLDIGVPPEIWGLLGISTTSFVTAATIKSQKKNLNVSEDAEQKSNEAWRMVGDNPEKLADPQGALVAYEKPHDASVSDLFKGDEVVSSAYLDLGKVQVFFFTVIVAYAYAAAVGAMLYDTQAIRSLPELSTGILALLSISHAGYLTAKAVPSNPADYRRP